MGTRIHVFLSHDLPAFDDPAATLARLDAALPAALAVRDYWDSVDPATFEIDRWAFDEPAVLRPTDERRYDGPGGLWVTVMPRAARIHTAARWRGFLTIEPLRRVHLAAFRAIARALHSPRMAICHDSLDDVTASFRAGGTQEDCVGELQALLGPPQPSIDAVAPEVVAAAERGVPDVWYLVDARAGASMPGG